MMDTFYYTNFLNNIQSYYTTAKPKEKHLAAYDYIDVFIKNQSI